MVSAMRQLFFLASAKAAPATAFACSLVIGGPYLAGAGGGGGAGGWGAGGGAWGGGAGLLREGRPCEGERRADAERDQDVSSHGPVSQRVARRGVMMLSKIGRLCRGAEYPHHRRSPKLGRPPRSG